MIAKPSIFHWTVVWSAIATAAFALPPQRAGQPGGAVGTADQGSADEFMPAQPGARSNTPATRRGAGLPAGQNEPAAVGAQGDAGPAAAGQGADPAAAGGFNQAVSPPLNRMFLAIDVNNDGIINRDELRRAAVSLRVLDADNDGNITLAEASPQIGPAGAAGQPGQLGGPNQLIDQMITQNDKNRDGQLTPDEIPPQMPPRMFSQSDANGDGILTRDELIAAMANMANQFGGMMGPGGMNNPQMDAMARFDRNRDGRLSPDEVPPQLGGMLQGADQNLDGVIDAREFAAAMSQMSQRFGGRGPGGEFPMGDGRGPARGPRGGQ
jgi:Ca2+-binding EF-hand superfamily protein